MKKKDESLNRKENIFSPVVGESQMMHALNRGSHQPSKQIDFGSFITVKHVLHKTEVTSRKFSFSN